MTTLEQLVTARQQEHSCARLRSILMRAAAEIEALTFPGGEPSRHYDHADMPEHILDLLPTWEQGPEPDAADRRFDAIHARHDAMRGVR